jgi:hypothetical protein
MDNLMHGSRLLVAKQSKEIYLLFGHDWLGGYSGVLLPKRSFYQTVAFTSLELLSLKYP